MVLGIPRTAGARRQIREGCAMVQCFENSFGRNEDLVREETIGVEYVRTRLGVGSNVG
jgi:hypothetical protein